ncbi:hypothetical protein I7I53_10872 [Histoplasma capsulatum var. duboisii H88]|uniref:Uncharacterized protein n=1 Tax=Ajellomyces capsulatus (strain H88) TaxID=544711 RepID=A0A8A1L766_AJEC8|nr:hypothetical protein I7I53_10872 [Histoplasma capsulatum var. duboisii H88]
MARKLDVKEWSGCMDEFGGSFGNLTNSSCNSKRRATPHRHSALALTSSLLFWVFFCSSNFMCICVGALSLLSLSISWLSVHLNSPSITCHQYLYQECSLLISANMEYICSVH